MGSLTSALSIAVQALEADQGAIAVTTNNISNANTPGYARQIPQFSESDPIQVGNLIFGSGVTLDQARTVRDNILQLRLAQESQQSGQFDSFLNGMNQVGALFNQTTGTGLQAPISAFFSSLQELSTDPSSPSLRVGVLSAAQNLATAFNQTSAALSTQQSNLDQSVTQSVSQINQLTGQIAQLNGQISGLSGAGEDASALIEQRDVLLQSLSNFVNVNVVNAGNNSDTITAGNGSPLVVGTQSYALQLQTNTVTGFQDIYSQGQDITSQLTSGALGGQIQVRDQQIPSVLQQLDTLASSIASSVNTQNQAGFDLNGNAGGNIFTPPPAGGVGAAASLSVAITDPSLIAASSDGSPGSNGNADALAALANQQIVNGQTPSDYYSATVSEIGNAISNATSELSSVQQVTLQLQNQRDALSAVSLNEEAANLTQFQQAYDASARVVTIISTLTQEAVNLGQD